MRRAFPECYKDGAFQNWSRRVKVNDIEYTNEPQPSDYGYYVNGYDVFVSRDKLVWTEWTSENKEIPKNNIMVFFVRGDELLWDCGMYNLYALGWRQMSEQDAKEYLKEYADQKEEFAKEAALRGESSPRAT